MKKIIVFFLVLLFISKMDLSNLSTEISDRFSNINTLFANLKINEGTTKDIINYIRDPKDFLTDIIDKDFEKLHQELNTLEEEYYNKLLIDYKINKTELIEIINKTEENKEMAKKLYIMEHTDLDEMEYYQIFVFPFNKVDKPNIDEDLSFTDFKDEYENYLIESINYLENKLDN